MTSDEFQRKYHNYHTRSQEEAEAEAAKANAEGIDGDTAVAVEFPGLGWCLMLQTAVDAIKVMGII